jgi:hypothetical protein
MKEDLTMYKIDQQGEEPMSKIKKDLVLGDYVPVHVSETIVDQGQRNFGPPADILEKHAAFFLRIQKERKELNALPQRQAA